MEKSTQKMLGRNRRRAEGTGLLYLLGSLIIAVACYFPLVYGLSTQAGTLWVGNFWQAYVYFTMFSTDLVYAVVNVVPPVLYAVLLLVVTINLICQIARLHRLYRKKPSRKSGYNRNVDSMEKMGKTFSCSFFTMIALTYIIHLLTGAKFTGIFYIALFLAYIFHFWAGIKGAKTSMIIGTENPVEDKRRWGRFAPFVRNLAQFLFVTAIMVFLANANTIGNLYVLLNKDYLSTVFGDLVLYKEEFYTTLVFPVVQVLLVVFTFILLKHTTNTTEFNRDGAKGKGMKNFRVFAFLIFLFAGLYVFACYVLGGTTWLGDPISVKMTMNMIYVAIVAFAAFLEEVCMAKLPNQKKKYQEPVIPEEPVKEEEKPAEAVAAAPAQQEVTTIYTLPVKCISEPGIFMQPNGTPVMIMPMVAAKEVEQKPVTFTPAPAPAPVEQPVAVEPVVEPVAPVVETAAVVAPVVEEPTPVVEEPTPVVEEPAPAPVELDEETIAKIKRAKELKAKWIDIARNGVQE